MGWINKAKKNIATAKSTAQRGVTKLGKGDIGGFTKETGQFAADLAKGVPVADQVGKSMKYAMEAGADPAKGVKRLWQGDYGKEGQSAGGQPTGYDPGPQPTIGAYQAAYTGGTYQAPTASALSGPESFQGIEGMRSVAKDNPWLGLANKRQGLEEQQLLGSAGKLAAQSGRQAQSNLAMRGGLRSGASERMARQGAMEQALAQQGVRSQGALTRASYDVEGEKMRQDMLGQLAGAEQGYAGYQTGAQQWNALQAAEADKWGREQGIAEGARRGEYDKYKFGEEAKMFGAGKTADAIARSGGKAGGSWFGMG